MLQTRYASFVFLLTSMDEDQYGSQDTTWVLDNSVHINLLLPIQGMDFDDSQCCGREQLLLLPHLHFSLIFDVGICSVESLLGIKYPRDSSSTSFHGKRVKLAALQHINTKQRFSWSNLFTVPYWLRLYLIMD